MYAVRKSVFMSQPLSSEEDFFNSVTAHYLLNMRRRPRRPVVRKTAFGELTPLNKAERYALSRCMSIGCDMYLDLLAVDGGVLYLLVQGPGGLGKSVLGRAELGGRWLIAAVNANKCFEAEGDFGLLKGSFVAGYILSEVADKYGGEIADEVV